MHNNSQIFEKFMGPVAPAMRIWESTFHREVKEKEGWIFETHEYSDRVVEQAHEPVSLLGNDFFTDRRSMFRHLIFSFPHLSEINQARFSGVKLDYRVPLEFIKDPVLKKYTLYNVRFCINSNDARFDHANSLPLRTGYFGITGRTPFIRFMEHMDSVKNGTGYALHKNWRSLIDNDVDFYPVFKVMAQAHTLKEIYELEEQAVRLSLTPFGLNVIPGGEAGIRMLHQLALLNTTKCGVDERDEALSRLEAGIRTVSAHYRSAHIRRLSPQKTTWVSACWVNLAKVA